MSKTKHFLLRRVADGAKTLIADELIVGRSPECALVLPVPEGGGRTVEPARKCARLVVSRGVLWMEDLGSKHGSFVNGSRLDAGTMMALQLGDQLRMDQIEFLVQEPGPLDQFPDEDDIAKPAPPLESISVSPTEPTPRKDPEAKPNTAAPAAAWTDTSRLSRTTVNEPWISQLVAGPDPSRSAAEPYISQVNLAPVTPPAPPAPAPPPTPPTPVNAAPAPRPVPPPPPAAATPVPSAAPASAPPAMKMSPAPVAAAAAASVKPLSATAPPPKPAPAPRPAPAVSPAPSNGNGNGSARASAAPAVPPANTPPLSSSTRPVPAPQPSRTNAANTPPRPSPAPAASAHAPPPRPAAAPAPAQTNSPPAARAAARTTQPLGGSAQPPSRPASPPMNPAPAAQKTAAEPISPPNSGPAAPPAAPSPAAAASHVRPDATPIPSRTNGAPVTSRKNVTSVMPRPKAPQEPGKSGEENVPAGRIAPERTTETPDTRGPMLRVLTGALAGRHFTLESPPGENASWRIGRNLNQDIILPHVSVSGEHARIVNQGGHWEIIDQLSRTGTCVNGRHVMRSPLVSGDRLLIGAIQCAFEFAGQTAGGRSVRRSRRFIDVPALIISMLVTSTLVLLLWKYLPALTAAMQHLWGRTG